MDTIDLRLPRRDVGRLLALTTERRKKLDRGVAKFGKDFDPALGANMVESREAFTALEQVLKKAMG